MTVAHTSRYSYNRIKHKIGRNQEIVYNTIKELGEATNEMISDALEWPINRVTGRVTELRKYGMIDTDNIAKTKSGHVAKLWYIRHPNDEQLSLIEQDCEV